MIIAPKFDKKTTFLMLSNVGLFLALSLVSLVLFPTNEKFALVIPLIYFLLSLLVVARLFVLSLMSSPLTWFQLGSGVFFGLGAYAGGMHVHPHSNYLFGESSLHLISVNLLNSVTVSVVFAAFFAMDYLLQKLKAKPDPGSHNLISHFENGKRLYFYWLLCVICALSVFCKLIFFPLPENLLIRGLLTKLYFITPTFIWISVYFWNYLRKSQKFVFVLIFALEMFVAILIVSKQHVVTLFVAALVGAALRRYQLKYVLALLALCMFSYLKISPVVTLSRANIKYDSVKNTLYDRLAILSDSIATLNHPTADISVIHYSNDGTTSVKPTNFQSQLSYVGRIRDFGIRFDVATIQGFLIREYDQNRAGESLEDFWVVFIPRMFWAEKPNVTRFGHELNGDFFQVKGVFRDTRSSLAPTFNGEAYWNYGMTGVLVVSFILGLLLAYFNYEAKAAVTYGRLGYFLLFYQIILWAANVEAWIVGSYLGEFVILAVMLNAFNFLFHFFRYLELKWHGVLEKKYELQKLKNHR